MPDARGYWMAQSGGEPSLCGRPGISFIVGGDLPARCSTAKGWDAELLADVRRAHRADAAVIGPPGTALGEVAGLPGCVLEGGSVDAFAEQLVAGASRASATCS